MPPRHLDSIPLFKFPIFSPTHTTFWESIAREETEKIETSNTHWPPTNPLRSSRRSDPPELPRHRSRPPPVTKKFASSGNFRN
ncbi:hypothetical protein ABKV19_018853 [Rosa sericea]